MNEIVIGNQIWADEDLKIDDGQGGIVVRKFPLCGENGLGNVYYYNQEALERVTENISDWKLPSKQDFIDLLSYVGNNNYVSGCKSIVNKNTARNLTSNVNTQYNATLGGSLRYQTFTDGNSNYYSEIYYRTTPTAMIDTYTRCIGLESRYWCSDLEGISHCYYAIRPDDIETTMSSRGRTYQFVSKNTDLFYIPIRLIKDA